MKKLIFVFIALFIVASTFIVNAQDNEIDTSEINELVVEEVMKEPAIVQDPFAGLDEYIRTVVENSSSGRRNQTDRLIERGTNVIIPLVAIVFSFLFPLGVIGIVFYTKHKEKKAKYALAEKALATGRDIPEGLFNSSMRESASLTKGIKNMCLGLAIGVFLWAVIGEFWAACIGLIIFFNGLGQFLIYRVQPADDLRKNRRDKDKWEDKEDIPYVDIDTDNNGNPER